MSGTPPGSQTHAFYCVLLRGLQPAVRQRIHERGRAAPEGRLRKKLEKWTLPLFPRLRAQRALGVAARLRGLVPPRVVAAVIRTWYDGWCSQRRFQARGSCCLFGRGHGEDSVQHYIWCRVLYAFATSGMRRPARDGVAQQPLALMLLEPAADLPDESFNRRALLVAAVHQLNCTHRRRCAPLGTPLEVPRALEQAVKTAARGHQRATSCLDRRWIGDPPRGTIRRRALTP